ncbi:hypothetical protein P692DRAFT_20694050, partial [Suillus brevipes Sb2]
VTGLSVRHSLIIIDKLTVFLRYFKRILNAFSPPPIYSAYVQLPDADDETPLEILQNSKFYPYFANTIGAIGGTHIACHPSASEHDAACNHK